jgi:hypothetical protein
MSISAQFPALPAHPAAFCTTTAFKIAEAEIPMPELHKRGPNGPLLVPFKLRSDREGRRLRPSDLIRTRKYPMSIIVINYNIMIVLYNYWLHG